MLEAILWDVDGTLAETERDGHLVAMNAAFMSSTYRGAGTTAATANCCASPVAMSDCCSTWSRSHRRQSHRRRRTLAQAHPRAEEPTLQELVASGALPLRAGVRGLFDECGACARAHGDRDDDERGNVDALLGAYVDAAMARRALPQWCAPKTRH